MSPLHVCTREGFAMLRGHAPGRSSDLPYWSVLSMKVGERVNGWLAGPCVGYEVHHVGTSRPCLRDITSGELPCPLCDAKITREWRGYVPIWDELVTRRVVLIGKRYFHLIEKVRHLQPIMARKLREWGSPVCVQHFGWNPGLPMLREADNKPQDLGDWLVQMWKEPALTEWVRSKKLPDLPAPVAPVAAGEVSPMLRAASIRADVTTEVLKRARAVKPEPGPSLLGDSLPAVTKNGVHKKG